MWENGFNVIVWVGILIRICWQSGGCRDLWWGSEYGKVGELNFSSLFNFGCGGVRLLEFYRKEY